MAILNIVRGDGDIAGAYRYALSEHGRTTMLDAGNVRHATLCRVTRLLLGDGHDVTVVGNTDDLKDVEDCTFLLTVLVMRYSITNKDLNEEETLVVPPPIIC